MIEIRDLQKRFGPIQAVRGISFDVHKGEVLGFLGPNGAGKSTTMRMVTGFIPATAGTVSIGGFDISESPEKAKALIGYLPENAPSYPDMTVEAFLRFAGGLRGLKGAALADAVEKAVATCHLEKVRRQTIDTLSKGFRHRTCFAQAILSDPPVLILDEPTDGLDPNQKREMRELIKEMGRTKAIIVSTHILEEVEAICSRVIIIDRGAIVFNGTPDEMLNRSAEAGRVFVEAEAAEPSGMQAWLAAVPGVASAAFTSSGEGRASFLVLPADKKDRTLASRLKKTLDEHGVNFTELHTDKGRLDGIFHELTSSDSQQEAKP